MNAQTSSSYWSKRYTIDLNNLINRTYSTAPKVLAGQSTAFYIACDIHGIINARKG